MTAKKSISKKTTAKKRKTPVRTTSETKTTIETLPAVTSKRKTAIQPNKATFELIKGGVTAAAGFNAGGVRAGIKSAKKTDLGAIVSDCPADAAGVFTTNALRAPSVDRCDALLPYKGISAIICNAGCANSCTGAQGAHDNTLMATMAAEALDIAPNSVLTASTGVIGKFLPMKRIKAAMPKLMESLSPKAAGGTAFAQAIMTTDLVKKESAVHVKCGKLSFTIGATAKGAGMIHPNMATMLCFITTDVAIDRTLLDLAIKRVVKRTFNNLTIDGDTSTNDMILAMANGASGVELGRVSGDFKVFEDALFMLCDDLCKKLAADGEGATKCIAVNVTGARTEDEAQMAAKAVAGSVLTKCAMFGNDPNWGRIACAIGNSGARISRKNMAIDLCKIRVFESMLPVEFNETRMQSRLQKKEVSIDINLGLGIKEATAYTCDFSYDYVKINAEYHT
ncbi:MAG: bifunctional glutamate N-acetyltransferase/amino-acid acetyltransferase ArgJ [Chitinispirillales bacterium]|jgi:glutamate N-acetyltransferase/amino-acid N-acetyltransferase|nr:bifunctional glutamate N-acetyltransferase/amino-acid acetyltransferase ArgJ [Chitinispirillales bacterium]